MDLDSQNGSLAGQACDMMLKLFAPEYQHKPWNYYGSVVNYLEEGRGKENSLCVRGPHRTVRTGATHTELGKFYRELHSSLLTANVGVDIIYLASPLFDGVSEELFDE